MTRAHRPGMWYGAGLLGVGLVSAAAGALAEPRVGQGIWLAAAVSLAVQGPLGWWLIRSIGAPGFFGAWVVGMLARIGSIGVMALVVLPLLGWPLEPALVAMAALLLVLLLLEWGVAFAWMRRAMTGTNPEHTGIDR